MDANTLIGEIMQLTQQGRRPRVIVCTKDERDALTGAYRKLMGIGDKTAELHSFMGVPIETVQMPTGARLKRYVWDEREYQQFLDGGRAFRTARRTKA